jgi:hypothetical protein
MKKKWLIYFCLITLALIFVSSFSINVKAQNYSFDVNYEIVDVYIERDGSITIEYWIEFYCKPGAHVIDIVDIGFPSNDYDLDSVEADIDGVSLPDIRRSTVISIGVEIWLHSNSIQPGQSGVLHVIGNNPNMIYGDYENQSMASVEFSPTWFDPNYSPVFEYLEVNFYFPPNYTNGNLVKWHYREYNGYRFELVDDTDYLIYTWNETNTAMGQYMYGVSFPNDWIDVTIGWTADPRVVMFIVHLLLTISIIGLIIGFSFLIYRYIKNYQRKYYPPRKRTNPGDFVCMFIVFALLGAVFYFVFWSFLGDILIILTFFAVIIAGFGMIGYLIYKLVSRFRLPYTKPEIKIESVGVNKNLTVVEAAIIKNTPLNKVIFLIIFGLIRTGHLKVIETEPLKFEVLSTKGINEMNTYHKKFLKAIITEGRNKGTIPYTKIKTILVDLIRATYRKMSGYELDITAYYYDNMINQAWEAIKKLPNEIEWENIEKHYDWIILDDLFEKRSERYLSHRYYIHYPHWYPYYYWYPYYWPRHHYYRYHPSTTAIRPPTQHINIHTFSDSIVRGIENISNTIVVNFSNLAESIVNTVSPVVQKSRGGRGGYSGGGGRSCACACACAGCACACAGGGR